MRSIFLFALFAVVLVLTLGAPAAGLLGWTWLSLMTPHKLAWGIAASAQLNLILAIVTILAWLFSAEPKRLPMTLVTWLWLLFIVVITVTTFFALNPELAWDRWSATIKVMALGIMVAIVMTDPKRLHALIWVIVLSLGYFSVDAGLRTIITLGHSHISGPPGTSIGDNNYLALAMCMTLPLMYYLAQHSAHRLSRIGLTVAMVVSVIGILGTYSRGGIIGLGIMLFFLWWRSRRRLVFAIAAIIIAVPTIEFMPANWSDRVTSIGNATSQTTFLTRLDAWKVAYNLASARPLIGGGFGATENPDIYQQYSYGKSIYAGDRHLPEIQHARKKDKLSRQEVLEAFSPDFTGGHAVHSIYLQVLADHGYTGLTIFLLLLGSFWRLLSRIRVATRNFAEQKWAHDLVTMLQVSMLTYFTAGAGVSMCYYDLPYLFMGITLAIRTCVAAAARQAEPVNAASAAIAMQTEGSQPVPVLANQSGPMSPGSAY